MKEPKNWPKDFLVKTIATRYLFIFLNGFVTSANRALKHHFQNNQGDPGSKSIKTARGT